MILDTALRELETAGRPVRVGMIGAGATGRAIALQLGTPVPGVRLVAIANRTAQHGERAFREAGVEKWSHVDSPREADAAIAGTRLVTADSVQLTIGPYSNGRRSTQPSSVASINARSPSSLLRP